MSFFTRETKSLYIQRPDVAAKSLVYLHPDRSIPRGASLTVRSDECAVFFREGVYVNTLQAGSYQLDTANIPFLGHLLIDSFTGAAHFVTELYFVTLAEFVAELPPTALGQYIDQNSRNVVTVIGQGAYSLRVQDPQKLITQLGGQSALSGPAAINILNGRMLNGFRSMVGLRSSARPILDVVSNIDAEAMSSELIQFALAEFQTLGIRPTRILNLNLALDEESLLLLRDFGKREADLNLQAKGSRLATTEGFAEYNLVQGQRAALEGLGKGLSTGNASMIMGLGMGGDLTGATGTRNAAKRAGSPRSIGQAGAAMMGAQRYFVSSPDGVEEGPYTSRQICLIAISSGKHVGTINVRREDDPPGISYPADQDSAISSEFAARTASRVANAPKPENVADSEFEATFNAVSKSGRINKQALDLLVQQLLDSKRFENRDAALVFIVKRAAAQGVELD